MEDSKDKFYFEGKYFDTGGEFVKYFNEWKDFSLDIETADRNLNKLKKIS